MNIEIIGSAKLVLPAELGGTPDPLLRTLYNEAKGTEECQVSVTRTADVVRITVPRSGVSDQEIAYIQSKGFLVSAMPVFIQMSAETYALEVPEGIPNRDLLDGEGTPIGVKTWEQWHDATHEHRQLSDATWVVPGNSDTGSRELTLAELEPLRADTAYTLLSIDAYRDILVNEPQPDGV